MTAATLPPCGSEPFHTSKCECVRVHGILQHVGAVLRLLQQASFHDEAQHLLVGQTLVGLLRERGDFPQDNAKRPVGGGQEGDTFVRLSLSETIWICLTLLLSMLGKVSSWMYSKTTAVQEFFLLQEAIRSTATTKK